MPKYITVYQSLLYKHKYQVAKTISLLLEMESKIATIKYLLYNYFLHIYNI